MSVRIPAPSPHPSHRRPLLQISVICSFFCSVPPPLSSFAPLHALTLYLLRPALSILCFVRPFVAPFLSYSFAIFF